MHTTTTTAAAICATVLTACQAPVFKYPRLSGTGHQSSLGGTGLKVGGSRVAVCWECKHRGEREQEKAREAEREREKERERGGGKETYATVSSFVPKASRK